MHILHDINCPKLSIFSGNLPLNPFLKQDMQRLLYFFLSDISIRTFEKITGNNVNSSKLTLMNAIIPSIILLVEH